MKPFSGDFFFTVQSLSCFEFCPIKFKRIYIDGVRWDSPVGDGDGSMEKGREFHLAARRYFSGIEPCVCGEGEAAREVGCWIGALKNEFPISAEWDYRPEFKLRLVSGIRRLEANLDLLLLKRDTAEIWDWKTHPAAGQKAGRDYAGSLQTMVYLYVVSQQLPLLTGRSADGVRAVMKYWQPEPPGTVAEIPAEDGVAEKFGKSLEEKIKNIYSYKWESFERRLYLRQCGNCEFNRLCGLEFGS